MDNNKLIIFNQNNLPERVSNTLKITEKLIGSKERKLVIKIFKKNPKLFIALIIQYIYIDELLIEKYKKEVVHYFFNPYHDEKYIIENENKLFCIFLIRNNSKIWSESFIDKYLDDWDWDGFVISSKNLDSVIKHVDKFNWNCIRDVTDINFLKKYRKNLDMLYWLGVITWTDKFIDELIENDFFLEAAYYSDTIPWTVNIFEKYSDELTYKNYSMVIFSRNCNFPWTEDFFEKYIDKWHWKDLSENSGLPWTLAFFEKYIDKWNWENLSKNSGLPWTEDFLEMYSDKWNWSNLSENTGLPWTEDFFEKYIDKWDWMKLPKNTGLPWSEEFFERYIDNWYLIPEIFYNESIPWTIKMIKKYNIYFFDKYGIPTWFCWSNKPIKLLETLEPFIDKELINEVFEHIKLKK
jgi:hypothetical protein